MPVAVITGASRGLGRALAQSLADDGWSLVVTARHAPTLDAAARALGAHVVAVAGDVADARHRAEVVDAARRLGGLDLLVNNASGLGPQGRALQPLAEYPVDVVEALYAVNVIAPLALTQLALPLLRTSRGRVINISSDAAVEAYEGWGAYGSTKAALDQLSRVLAAEVPDVRVYAVDPGDLRTQMHQDAFPGEDISDRPLPDTVVPAFRRLVDGDLPSGRYRAAELLDSEAVS